MKDERALALTMQELSRTGGFQFDLKSFCHPKQHAFVTDPHPYATAVTSRRSGKTTGCAADLISTCISEPQKTALYITLTRSNAKKIIWPVLLHINREFRLHGEPNIADLSIEFPNESRLYLAGVNDSQQIHNFRGLALKLVYLDEAQSMRHYIEELVNDVLAPALIDEAGRLRVTGTPGAVPVGYFHEMAHSEQWSHHFFTMFDNPFLQMKSGHSPEEILLRELARRGVGRDHPSIQREFFGRWVLDLDALVIHYDAQHNHYDQLPDVKQPWDHVIGVDLGFEDSDAIAVIGFHQRRPEAYLREEIVRTKQGITELAAQIGELIKRYDPLKIVMDTGGLGKKIAEEISRRYGIPIQAAEKDRKNEFIELLNDALRTRKLFARRDSRFANDAMLLEWDRENPEKPKISDRFHSDIVDAVLYAYRESMHWIYEPEVTKPKIGSIEHYEKQIDEAWKKQEEQLEETEANENFWQDPFEM